MAIAGFLAIAMPHADAAESVSEPTAEFGGWSETALAATDRFRIETWRGGQWFVTPSGHPWIGVALAHGNRPPPAARAPGDATAAKFGDDLEAYVRERAAWMQRAGFNAFSYTNPESAAVDVPWIATLPLIPGFINFGPRAVDLFDPIWRQTAAETIARNVPELARDRRVIGVSLAFPVLASPHMMPPWTWEWLGRPPTNLLRELKALDRNAPGKRAYLAHLKERYGTLARYVERAPWLGFAREWDDLLVVNLGRDDGAFTLSADDVEFYTRMWSEAVGFLANEIRRQAPGLIVFSPRVIGLRTFPDPWLDAWLAGVGPHVDAFLPELYAADQARVIVDHIGRATGKPSFVADGMRSREFNYETGEEADRREADDYRRMFYELIGSPWFLGGTVCEYRPRLAEFRWYAAEPQRARTGIRQADYAERPALLEVMRELHARKYRDRVKRLEVK